MMECVAGVGGKHVEGLAGVRQQGFNGIEQARFLPTQRCTIYCLLLPTAVVVLGDAGCRSDGVRDGKEKALLARTPGWQLAPTIPVETSRRLELGT